MVHNVVAYWWLVIPVALIFLALLFSLERRGGKEKRIFPENYIDGLKAFIDNDENTAFVKLKQAVADDTDNIDAYLKLGDLFRKKGQYERAIRIHKELILRHDIDPSLVSQVRQSLAIDYINSKKYELALWVLEKLSKDSDYKLWAQERILEVYDKTGRWEKAFDTLKSLSKVKNQPSSLAAYKLLMGNNFYDEGEFHKARVAYKDALHFDDKFADAYIMIAESYLAEDRKQDAAEFYKKLANKIPSEVYRVSDKMEQTLFEMGKFSDVKDIYERILETEPGNVEVLKSLAGIAEKRGDVTGAIDYLSTAASVSPGDGQVTARLLELYIQNNRKNKTHELLQSIKQNLQSDTHRYVCPNCKTVSSKPEIICQNCGRVGPYKRA